MLREKVNLTAEESRPLGLTCYRKKGKNCVQFSIDLRTWSSSWGFRGISDKTFPLLLTDIWVLLGSFG